LGSCGNSRSRFGAPLFGFATTRCCLWRLLDSYPYPDFLVAPAFTPLHQFRLLETMKNSVESLLEELVRDD